ncbi:DUF2955 domain-containing protein [Shewanella sp. 10N.286.51.B8]|uniref:DUF2955 domain-containing protein n=1 Tax=Shewanella sp. 10N.286.51.B8 TaxID=3229708 RepID=UPI00354F844F
MLLRFNPMTANDLRQCLRIATGGTIGFTLCKLFGFSNGVFFTVTPMVLLGLAPMLTAHVARQVLASSVTAGLVVGVIGGLFGGHPVLMTLIIFGVFVGFFTAMTRGSFFLYGANSLLNLSIMLNFASYPDTDLNGLIGANLGATILAIIIAYIMVSLIPDVEPRKLQKPPAKSVNRMRHEVLLGATIATASFIVFQIFNLQDSMSAQAATILLLYPMHFTGVLNYALKRAIGTFLGVTFGVLAQLFLYDWSGLLILVVPVLWFGLMLFSQVHVKENVGAGVGFGAMTTLGILFGQYLSPGSDLIYSALYRISSILVAIVATLLLCYIMHTLLNRFAATRLSYQ